MSDTIGVSLSIGTVEATDVITEECVHFWLIEPPNGPTSYGSCRQCGVRQEFRNSVETSSWNKGGDKAEDSWT
ncbi:MAG: hypothetical protein DK304_000510 [Chloroflexi bacterium]|nr:MAG: hypothetical protein DK304_000510 [Chloroflexota bacterium]